MAGVVMWRELKEICPGLAVMLIIPSWLPGLDQDQVEHLELAVS